MIVLFFSFSCKVNKKSLTLQDLNARRLQIFTILQQYLYILKVASFLAKTQ
jgi:hypothetical protein